MKDEKMFRRTFLNSLCLSPLIFQFKSMKFEPKMIIDYTDNLLYRRYLDIEDSAYVHKAKMNKDGDLLVEMIVKTYPKETEIKTVKNWTVYNCNGYGEITHVITKFGMSKV